MSLIEIPLSGAALAIRVNNPWTIERIDLLKKLWADGLSASQIGGELGVTRNSVLGKKDRLGLEDRVKGWGAGAPIQHGRRSKRLAGEITPKPRTPRLNSFRRTGQLIDPTPAVDADTPSLTACAIIDLTDNNCHFPIGHPDKPGFHYCGGKAAGGPYCAGHHRIAHAPPRERVGRNTHP